MIFKKSAENAFIFLTPYFSTVSTFTKFFICKTAILRGFNSVFILFTAFSAFLHFLCFARQATMMLSEFINRLPKGTRPPTDNEYEEIELVYACHPSISESGHEGQEQIARLYSEFGMRIIYDMFPTAKKAERLRTELISAKNTVEQLTKELKELSMK